MSWRPHSPLRLFLALLLVLQSFSPVAALAEVSVRCVGTPGATPCLHMVVPLNDKPAIASRLSRMACCRSMIACRSMASGCGLMAPAAPHRAAALSAPKCLITISPLSDTRPAAVCRTHHWLLDRSPALAPPAARPAANGPASLVSLTISPSSYALPPRLLMDSHGLRAPPCA